MPHTSALHGTIVRRVYAIIALFIALTVGLTVAFIIQVNSLIAIRAFVGAETLWAKAQKDAVLNLKRYGESRDEADYGEFHQEIRVPLGDQLARVELENPNPDLNLVRQGFLQGRIHPDDIEYMIPFFLRFRHTPYMATTIRYWIEGDRLIGELVNIAKGLRGEMLSGRADPVAIRAYIARLDDIDYLLSALEVSFSATLAEISRWAYGLFRNLTYAVVFFSMVLGLGLSWPLIRRIRAIETAVYESEERFRSLAASAQDAIISLDDAGRIVFWNDAATRMFGFGVDEVLNQNGHLLLAPERYLDAYRAGWPEFAKSGRGAVIGKLQELSARRKDGAELSIELSVAAVQLAGHWHALGVIRDITERKRVEERMLKLNEELEIKIQKRTKQLVEAQGELVRKEKLAVLGQVAGSVGHELRNPLGVMSNAVYFLQTMLTGADETTKEYLNIIKDEIAGSERIVSDLLDAVRTKPPQVASVSVREVVEKTLQKCAIPSSVTVTLDAPDTLPLLRVDALQMQQVFRNLITNAVESMPEGGRLDITGVANDADKTVTVSVRDSGCGIAPVVIGKIFNPLFTTKARGIGLGLVVVENLTKANSGAIRVESEVGKGSVFSITLPSEGGDGSDEQDELPTVQPKIMSRQ